MGFNIIPNGLYVDFDFIVFDVTNKTCGDLLNQNLTIACNFSSVINPSPITGLNGGFNMQDEAKVFLPQNRKILILVNNFLNTNSSFNIDFSLCTFNPIDQIAPKISNAYNHPLGAEYIFVRFSETVLCSTVTPSYFYVQDALANQYEILDVYGIHCEGSNTSLDYLLKVNQALLPFENYSLHLTGPVSDPCGNLNQENLTFNFNTAISIDELKDETANWKIYPNPAQDFIELVGAARQTMQLIDITGNILQQFTVETNNQTIDLQSLSKGIYILRNVNQPFSKAVKLIKL